MKRRHFALIAIIAFSIGACKSSTSPSGGVSTTPIALWIAPASTTYISDAPTDTGTNMLLQGSLNIGFWDIPGNVQHHQVSFVKFVLPNLPAGSTIDHAYFEAYHGGQQEDGTTDNTQFWVSEIGVPFGFDTMTWNKSPDHGKYFQPPAPIVCQLHSKDWCGTHDIASTIQKWFSNPASNTGLRLNLASQSNFFKSFYSNRDLSRTDSTLGLAPRLLILLHIPDTASLTPLKTFAMLPPDENVRPGEYSQRTNLVRMDSLVSGSDFPASWGAKKGQ